METEYSDSQNPWNPLNLLMIVFKKFTIESARSLPNLPDSHPCKKIHGHSFKIIIYVKGQTDSKTGFVIDFNNIEKAFNPLKKKLDHAYLNNIDGLNNPSSENMCIWIWKKLEKKLPGLSMIKIKETNSTGCIYKGK